MSSAAFVNRARWRADLEDYHAALLGSVGLGRDAAARQASAELRRQEADLTVELETLRAAFLADPSDRGNALAYKAKSAELRELRRYWRGLGELAGIRRLATGVDEFAEPTDEELAS